MQDKIISIYPIIDRKINDCSYVNIDNNGLSIV